MAKQCQYAKNGKSCQAYAITESKFCFAHDPASAKKRAEARKKGGYNRRVKSKIIESDYYPIVSIKDINSILELTINEACLLENSHSKLRLLGYLIQIALKGQELGSLEERLNAIEKQIKERGVQSVSKNTYR